VISFCAVTAEVLPSEPPIEQCRERFPADDGDGEASPNPDKASGSNLTFESDQGFRPDLGRASLGMRAGVTLSVSSADLDRSVALVSDRNAPQNTSVRARIVLLSAEGVGTSAIMRETSKSRLASGAGRNALPRRA